MRQISLLAQLVKLEHTIFALPTAYAGMVLARRELDEPIAPLLVLLITLAMVFARTLAMALNRVIDHRIDALNPRTANREIPSGALTTRQVWLLSALMLLALLLVLLGLDQRTWWLWPIPVAMFVLYPYMKRFSALCHVVLGISIGLAPLGAWIASAGPADHPAPYLMSAALACWICGFDIIYATTDIDFDQQHGLHSIPSRIGAVSALRLTKMLHISTVILIIGVGISAQLSAWYLPTAALTAALLWRENTIISADDLSRVDVAFFSLNAWVGVVLGVGTIITAVLVPLS